LEAIRHKKAGPENPGRMDWKEVDEILLLTFKAAALAGYPAVGTLSS